jgi:hypothetical protein
MQTKHPNHTPYSAVGEMDRKMNQYYIPTYFGMSSGLLPSPTSQYDPLKQQLGGTATAYFEKLQEAKRRLVEKKLK